MGPKRSLQASIDYSRPSRRSPLRMSQDVAVLGAKPKGIGSLDLKNGRTRQPMLHSYGRLEVKPNSDSQETGTNPPLESTKNEL